MEVAHHHHHHQATWKRKCQDPEYKIPSSPCVVRNFYNESEKFLRMSETKR
jgi:hypothetical protein